MSGHNLEFYYKQRHFTIYFPNKNVLRFNINKVLSSNQENDNLFTPRPLFDGIMFLMACDDDLILKCEWIHISDGSWEKDLFADTEKISGLSSISMQKLLFLGTTF
jgi:hypothetical protein